MKYYCENCKGEFDPGDVIRRKPDYKAKECPFCGALQVCGIPDYETPQQYEKRAGVAYPDNGLVFVRAFGRWNEALRHDTARSIYEGLKIVTASPPVPPPDGFVPEA